MDYPVEHWLTAIAFEHACKHDFKKVIKNSLEDKELVQKILQYSAVSEARSSERPKIKPIFLLILLLNKLISALDKFLKEKDHDCQPLYSQVLPMIIELLESTFKQYSFISLKKYFTLISELKLLVVLNLILENAESSHIVQKLNLHFPRWNSTYKASVEKDFSLINPKVLVKVEESHTQCRRLILKLAVDKTYRASYMAEQYPNDMKKLVTESIAYLMEVVSALEENGGASVIEKIMDGKESNIYESDDLGIQLLQDYLQDNITDEDLLKFTQDLEPNLQSQATSGLASCLLPFDTMSEASDDDHGSDSEMSISGCESSEDIEKESIKSFADILPSNKSPS